MIPSHNTFSLLRSSLRANALFSGLCGFAFFIAAQPIADFLGLDTSWMIRSLGPGLLGYAFWLHLVLSRPTLNVTEVWSAIALDGAWVIGSAVLLVCDLLPLTLPGMWAVGITADVVAIFGVLQIIGLFKHQSALNVIPTIAPHDPSV